MARWPGDTEGLSPGKKGRVASKRASGINHDKSLKTVLMPLRKRLLGSCTQMMVSLHKVSVFSSRNWELNRLVHR